MIRDHVWRAFYSHVPVGMPEDACAYMGCRRPREEHARVSEHGGLVRAGKAAAKAARS